MDVTKTLWFSVQDIADCFYQFSIPSDMQEFFGLRPVKAHEVGIFSLNGLSVPKNTVLHPGLSVLPMGFSWALRWTQIAHRHLL